MYQDVDRYPPKWFLAITCTIWLRLEFRGLDSAWPFSPHLLFFMPGGRILSPSSECWTQGQHVGLGTFLGQKMVPKQKWCCDEITLWWQFRGIPETQMNSMVHRIHLGRLLCPTPLFYNGFQGISNFPGKLENAPACYPGHCLTSIPLGGSLFARGRIYVRFSCRKSLEHGSSGESPRPK